MNGYIKRRPRVSIIEMVGNIASGGNNTISLTRYSRLLDAAFRQRDLAAVVLRIESGGGSPSQAAILLRRLRLLADRQRVPVYAFVEEIATSAGYWLALAADEIYVEETSIVGSIGVVSTHFGFTGLLEKLGIERRIYAVGDDKARNDLFRKEDPLGVERRLSIQTDIHDIFKEAVMVRRGKRLAASGENIFSGAAYSGRRGVELGLVDGVGDMRSVLLAKFGLVPRTKFFRPKTRRFRFPNLSLSGFLARTISQTILALDDAGKRIS